VLEKGLEKINVKVDSKQLAEKTEGILN